MSERTDLLLSIADDELFLGSAAESAARLRDALSAGSGVRNA